MLRVLLLAGAATAARAQSVNYFGYTCPMGYKTCANCCDIDHDCHCDQFCPSHPEVWTKGGCAVPKSNRGVVKRGDFVCPSGYKKCKNCCDIEGDCKCNEDCQKSGYPVGFDCSLQKGQDQYTSASYNAVCPGGYNECSHSCDLNPDCKQDSRCLARAPKGFMCTMPKRHNADKTKLQGGRLEAFAFEKDYMGRLQALSFDQAEAKCRTMQGGHLMSIHSNEDYRAMKLAVNRARITQAVFIGGYERNTAAHTKSKLEGQWRWIDGTVFDKKILNGLKAQDFGNNNNMAGSRKNENQMVYCSAQCVNALMGGRGACPTCEGLHDWGNRQARDTAGVGGFVCRVNGASVGHLIDHRTPGGKAIYVEDGAMVCQGSQAMGTQTCVRKATGWSNNQITTAGRTGTVHGPWGMDTKVVTRGIRIPKSGGTGMCAVSWRSWAIYSRDGEVDQLLINGHAVWRQKAQMAFTVQTNGNACARGWLQGPRDFPNPWHGTNAPACYVDRTVAVSCKPNSIMKVTFMSGVDEQKNNEAWAFSDFSVHVRPRPKRPPRKTSIINSKCTTKNFHQKITYMSNICCKGKGTKCSKGMPIICRANCAKAIFRLNHQCRTFIRRQHGMQNTMNTAMSRCYHEGGLVNKGGSGCTRAKPCRECQGDCDADADCQGKLTCFQRNQHQRVTGCALGGRSDVNGYDYCVNPAIMQYLGPRGCTRQKPCLACQGDCDNDAECKGPLKCKQRNGLASVGHGCKRGGRGDAVNQDFCYSPSGMH
jgi:hypothetical protein